MAPTALQSGYICTYCAPPGRTFGSDFLIFEEAEELGRFYYFKIKILKNKKYIFLLKSFEKLFFILLLLLLLLYHEYIFLIYLHCVEQV